MNELEYLRQQLNLIIGFLDVSDEDVYESIKKHDKYEMGQSIDDLYGNKYSNYQNHITTSALILGFTHFEDFLTKMVSKILLKYPKKNKIKITICDFEKIGENYKEVLAEDQSRRMTFAEKIKLVNSTYLNFDDGLIENMRLVNNIRNCLMHHNGFADKRLEPKYFEGEKIILSSGEVHRYGLMARRFGDKIWTEINKE